MCIILFSYQPQSQSPLILGANRDEFFKRPTANAAFWNDHPQLLAGRDLQAGGTWLGVTTTGRFAAITNVREPGVEVKNPRSRGELTRDFLNTNQSPQSYLDQVFRHQHRYAGFNLLVGEFSQDSSSLYYLSNRGEGIEQLKPGTYGLSNHLLDSPWPKVIKGKNLLRTGLNNAGDDHHLIREILENPTLAEDASLPNTGVDYETEKALSATFISLPDYGTRTSTVLTIKDRRIHFSEQHYKPSTKGEPSRDGETGEFLIKIESQESIN